MKSISYKDLQRVSFLSHLSQFDMMSPTNDHLVAPALWEYGIDIERGLLYSVSYHRCLDRQARVGLVITGDIRSDKEFRQSPFCTLEDRMILAGLTDQSLARELASLQNVAQTNYGSEQALENEEDGELNQDIDEIERIEAEMEALGYALNNIRGDQYKRNGARKTMRDYQEAEPYEKPRRKKKNRTTLKHRHIEE